MHIYVQKLSILSLYAILIFLAFSTFLCFTRNCKTLSKTIAAGLSVVALYGILTYTVLGRTPSDLHDFVFAVQYSDEFNRKLFMNALLYYPLGLALTVLIGPWSILISLVLSILIESWQYFAGTGLAQGTDDICNTLGCAIGALPFLIIEWVNRK